MTKADYITCDDCERLRERVRELEAELEEVRRIGNENGTAAQTARDRIRVLERALQGLIGASDPAELRAMEGVLRSASTGRPDADVAVAINAIHALLGDAARQAGEVEND